MTSCSAAPARRHDAPSSVGVRRCFDRAGSRCYARAGIAQYVIVNLRNASVEVYERPIANEGRYGDEVVLRCGETLRLRGAALDLELDVARILP